MSNSFSVVVPANTTINMTGFVTTTSLMAAQQIIVTPQPGDDPAITWTETGPQVNKAVGQYVVSPTDGVTSLGITMNFMDNQTESFQPSYVTPINLSVLGMTVVIVLGVPYVDGPYYPNTVVFMYWEASY